MSEVAFREAATDELGPAVLAQILDLGHACWPEGHFTTDDLDPALGGRHFLAEADGRVIGHAAVVPRILEVGGRLVRTGYVGAVATLPRFQRRGIASRLMTVAGAHIAATCELGALSTGEPAFYERLGWRRWAGPTFVREPDGTLTRTPDEDDGIMILSTPASPPIDLTEPIACNRRPGDAWWRSRRRPRLSASPPSRPAQPRPASPPLRRPAPPARPESPAPQIRVWRA